MDEHVLVTTRRSLHAVAEQVLAGPQYRATGSIRLTVLPGGFGQVEGPLRIQGAALVNGTGRVPLTGTIADLAAAVGVAPGAPDNYGEHAEFAPDEELAVDAAAAELLERWFENGDAALRELAPDVERVLWPEHFDVGIQLDEVNYGVSPGDACYPRPYAYVGPWTPREGEFWNAPFGALRYADELPDAAAVAAFLAEGRRRSSRL
jgi:hypothetical protein